ncbi:MAG: Y-family DNA polymerase, partial [Chlamydiota bacterium]
GSVSLVDCNNFYVSCERLFNPRLEKRPVIVLSNNDGCVVSRSEEAKALGIAMGVPFFQIKNFCFNHSVEVFSSNYSLYGDISSRVMKILVDMVSDVEIYSIDEAFLQYPASMNSDEILEHCRDIRRKILQWVGIPTSLGIATTKTLAKLGSKLAKKDRLVGVFDVREAQVQEAILDKFPIGDVWGIGRRWEEKLRASGIRTAKEFRDKDLIYIRKKMGVNGERIWWELRGKSCIPLEERASKKSITCSRSFGQAVRGKEALLEAISTYVASACVKLREQDSCASALCVYVEMVWDAKTGKQNGYSMAASFATPTSNTSEVIADAKRCIHQLYREDCIYKKCGVVLLELSSDSEEKMDLFMEREDPKRKELTKTIDALNKKWGKDTVFYGAMGLTKSSWKMRSESRSFCYTTKWEELPVVKG